MKILKSMAIVLLLFIYSCGREKPRSTHEPKVNSSASVIDYDGINGIKLGRGYDSLSGEPLGFCVERTKPTADGESQAQIVEFMLSKVEDYHSLTKLLEMNASLSLRAGIGQAKGRSSFVNNISINDYSLYALVKVKVTNPTLIMDDVKLKDSIYKKLESSGEEAFRKQCGDEFVIGYTTGGEFYSIIEIKTKDEKQKEKINSDLKASYGSIKGGLQFSKLVEDILKTTSIQVFVYQTGGDTSIMNIDPNEMIKKASTFASEVKGDKAHIYKATLSSYDILDLPHGKNIFDISNQKDILEKLNEYQFRIMKNLSNLDYVIYNQAEFEITDLESLNEASNTLRESLNQVYRSAKSCFNNYTKCEYPTNISIPQMNLPKRKIFVKEEKTCAKPVYFEKTDPKCGVKTYKRGIGEVCGVDEYNTGTSPVCGILNFKLDRSEFCGVETYKSAYHHLCPRVGSMNRDLAPWYIENANREELGCDHLNMLYVRTSDLPKLDISGNGNIDHTSLKLYIPESIIDNYRSCKKSHKDQIICTNKWVGSEGIVCREKAPCRIKENDVELYKECRHPHHGNEYASCPHSSFGVKSFKECEHKEFGNQEYNTCRMSEFGTERCDDEIK